MRRRQADYLIRKNRRTGVWTVQWRNNEPIPHYSFDDARVTLINMLRLEIIWNTNSRGNRRD
ncbi:hypothetical protein [Rhodococcus phage REQ1]|uniref:hypothetical protein n=1 Tax=Rhodococcus phage REQ1 TaxID=1109712 RepID=UPI00023EEC4E|nr:hypothetical protein RoPhREQ1_gp44 [Rhodococcus phage REQ1]AEV52040.1 hypothetical protein [Rhodococcus phage REQ1]